MMEWSLQRGCCRPRSQSVQAAMPSPVLAESWRTVTVGLSLRISPWKRSMSKGMCGRRSVLVSSSSAGLDDDVGVFGGLVVAAADAEDADLGILAEVEADGADEVADVLDEEQVDLREVEARNGLADVVGFEVAAFAGVDLDDLVADSGPCGRHRAGWPCRRRSRRCGSCRRAVWSVFSISAVLPQPGAPMRSTL